MHLRMQVVAGWMTKSSARPSVAVTSRSAKCQHFVVVAVRRLASCIHTAVTDGSEVVCAMDDGAPRKSAHCVSLMQPEPVSAC